MQNWKKLEHILEESKSKNLTLVLGSGIHNNFKKLQSDQEKHYARLISSWDSLLKSFNNTIYENITDYSVLWELVSLEIENSKSLPAAERDKKLSKHVIEKLITANNILNNQENANHNILIKLLKTKRISDVIVLNLDLIFLNKLNKLSEFKVSRVCSTLTRKRIVQYDDIAMRFWYPHGDVKNINSITFGFWRYEARLRRLNEIFRNMKQKERLNWKGFYSNPINCSNWFELMISQNLLILGSSIATSEIDLCYSLIARWRNYAKFEGPKSFRLATYCDSSASHLPSDRVLQLCCEDWESSWSKLSQVFN